MKGTTLSDLQSRNQDTLLDFQFSDVASGIKKSMHFPLTDSKEWLTVLLCAY